MLLKQSGGYEPRDPSVIFHNGAYYHCFVRGAAEICVAKSNTLEKLISGDTVTVFTPEANKPYSKELWAPELHIINEICYIYVACDDGNNVNHRMYVLTNDSCDPMNPFRMVGKMSDESDRWAIDATVFSYGGRLYTVWSGWDNTVNDRQNLYIAEMSDPCTISSKRVLISTPEHDWEKLDCIGDGVHRPFINEGPFAYISDGELKGIFYSASGSWANHYCIGFLAFRGTDPMQSDSWVKQPFPALSIHDGWNGPGHCSLFSDGKSEYIAFHTYDEGKTCGWQNVHAVISSFKFENGKIVLLDF
ncbi:MAG: glycoside hydrolase family 43 protein [Clostridia bacterium]|nr:glycoside hydrolase family 43 protein [Clostridia bacterium]